MKDYIEFRDPANVVPPVFGKQFIVAWLDQDMYNTEKLTMLIKVIYPSGGRTYYNWLGAEPNINRMPIPWGWDEQYSEKINFLIASYNRWHTSDHAPKRIIRMFVVNTEAGLNQIFDMFNVSNQPLIDCFSTVFRKFQKQMDRNEPYWDGLHDEQYGFI